MSKGFRAVFGTPSFREQDAEPGRTAAQCAAKKAKNLDAAVVEAVDPPKVKKNAPPAGEARGDSGAGRAKMAESMTGFEANYHSRFVRIEKEALEASYVATKEEDDYALHGGLLGNGPLPAVAAGKYFELEVLRTREGHPDGLCDLTTPPDTMDAIPQTWIAGYDGLFWDPTEADMFPAPWNPSTLQNGDQVGVLIRPDGAFVVLVNGEVVLEREHAQVPYASDLFAVVDLLGSCDAVKLRLDARPSLAEPMNAAENVPQEEKEVKMSGFCLKKKGHYVRLSEDLPSLRMFKSDALSATYTGQTGHEMHGGLIGNEPLARNATSGVYFSVELTKTRSEMMDGLTLGVTTNGPKDLDEMTDTIDGVQACWTVGYDGQMYNGKDDRSLDDRRVIFTEMLPHQPQDDPRRHIVWVLMSGKLLRCSVHSVRPVTPTERLHHDLNHREDITKWKSLTDILPQRESVDITDEVPPPDQPETQHLPPEPDDTTMMPIRRAGHKQTLAPEDWRAAHRSSPVGVGSSSSTPPVSYVPKPKVAFEYPPDMVNEYEPESPTEETAEASPAAPHPEEPDPKRVKHSDYDIRWIEQLEQDAHLESQEIDIFSVLQTAEEALMIHFDLTLNSHRQRKMFERNPILYLTKKMNSSEVKLEKLSSYDKALFMRAKTTEVDSFLKNEAVRKRLNDAELRQAYGSKRIIRARWVLTWKPAPPDELADARREALEDKNTVVARDGTKKAKARIVLLGFEHLHSWTAASRQRLLCNLLLTEVVTNGTLETAREIQSMIGEVRANPIKLEFFPLKGVKKWNDVTFVSMGDQSHLNRPQGDSTGGLLTLATSPLALKGQVVPMVLISWRTWKLRRKAVGSNDAEVQSILEAEDQNFRVRLRELHGVGSRRAERRVDLVQAAEEQASLLPGVLCTDSRGGYDAIEVNESPLLGLSNMRAALQAFQLRDNLRRVGCELRWLASDYDLADGFTKKRADSLVHFTSPSSARAARQSRRDTTWPSGQALQMRAQSPGHARGANESKQRLRRAVAEKSMGLEEAIAGAIDHWPHSDPEIQQGLTLLASQALHSDHALDCDQLLQGLAAAEHDAAYVPSAEMQDLLLSARRIIDGEAGFTEEAQRRQAYAGVRSALHMRRLGVGAEEGAPTLREVLELAELVGAGPGLSWDDCVGEALKFQQQIQEQSPIRWALMASLLLGKSASFWESVTCIFRVQRATEAARRLGISHEELAHAYDLEARFERYHTAARRLDQALTSGENLTLALHAARDAAADGGQLQVQTPLWKAMKKLGQPSQDEGEPEDEEPEMAEDAPAVPRDPWALQHLKEALDCGSRPLMCLALRRAQEARLEPGLLAQAERYMEERIMGRERSARELHPVRMSSTLNSTGGPCPGRRRRCEHASSRSTRGASPLRPPSVRTTARGPAVLDEVVVVLKEFPGLSLRLEAHSNDSNALRAKALSQQRADAVKEQLRSCGCTNWITTVAWGIGHVIKTHGRACGKALAWESALSLLRGARGAIAFNAAMAGCGDAGEWSWTLWLFEEMLRQQLTRTEISFNACVNAMSLSLRWEQALQIYESMRPSLLRPEAWHFFLFLAPDAAWSARAGLHVERTRGDTVRGQHPQTLPLLRRAQSDGNGRCLADVQRAPGGSGGAMTPKPEGDHYQVLGVELGATNQELTKAYRKLALTLRGAAVRRNRGPPSPFVCRTKATMDLKKKWDGARGECEEAFKRITEAYDVLHDPQKRKSYDSRCGQAFQGPAAELERMFGHHPLMESCGGAYGEDIDFEKIFHAVNSEKHAVKGCGQAVVGVIPRNTAVILHSLSKTVQFNGREATVRTFDPSTGRYHLLMDGSAICVKPWNLTQKCSAFCRDTMGEGSPDVTIVGFDAGCYLVKTPSAEVGRLKPRELVLKEGTAASRAQHGGLQRQDGGDPRGGPARPPLPCRVRPRSAPTLAAAVGGWAAVEAGECEPSVALGRGLAAAEETEALALQSLHARLQARDCVRFDGGAQALEQRVRETRARAVSAVRPWIELLSDRRECHQVRQAMEELQLRAGQSLEALVRCGQAAQRVLQTMDRRCPGESEPCSTPSVERSPEEGRVSAHDAPLQVADVTLKLVPSEGDAVDRASQSDERYESASPLKKKATPGEPAGASFLAPPEPDSDVSSSDTPPADHVIAMAGEAPVLHKSVASFQHLRQESLKKVVEELLAPVHLPAARPWQQFESVNLQKALVQDADHLALGRHKVSAWASSWVLPLIIGVLTASTGTLIEEVKTILGGFVMKDTLSTRTLMVKIVGLMLSVSSGLALGKEGPTVHIACCWANVCSGFSKRYSQSAGRLHELLSVASAAGVSVAFGAPVGGVLFSYEEVSTRREGRVLEGSQVEVRLMLVWSCMRVRQSQALSRSFSI
eukprot:g26436.t1